MECDNSLMTLIDDCELEKKRDLFNDTLFLIIGEDIPDIRPLEYSKIEMYRRLNCGKLVLYSIIRIPYIVNFAKMGEFDSEDPRYYFYEGYEVESGGCRYICMIKPCGKYKGVYRLGLNFPFKIKDIDVLREEKRYLVLK